MPFGAESKQASGAGHLVDMHLLGVLWALLPRIDSGQPETGDALRKHGRGLDSPVDVAESGRPG